MLGVEDAPARRESRASSRCDRRRRAVGVRSVFVVHLTLLADPEMKMNLPMLLTDALIAAETTVCAAEAGAKLLDLRLSVLDLAILRLREVAQRNGIVTSARVVEPEAAAPATLSPAQFARHKGVSIRTIAKYRTQMTEGVHFEKIGRLIFFCVAEAAAFITRQNAPGRSSSDIETLAADEVTRLRARNALKKAGGSR